MKNFIDNPEILRLVEAIKKEGLDRKQYSDIVDEKGNQYVDLVQEGGGVLGIALAGYTYILEKAGIRFFSLAGTSAGAINTMMIAALGKTGDPVSEKIIDILTRKELSDFLDGEPRIKRLIIRYTGKRPFFKLFLFLNAFRIWRILKNHLGFNPGSDFEQWLTAILRQSGINSLADLQELRSRVPILFDQNDNYREITRTPGLKIIVSDITTKSKIVFPEMAGLYWDDPASVNPAKFIRASMSIPFFFYPFVVGNIPGAGQQEDRTLPVSETRWRKHAGYYGKIPRVVRFVDGGMLSNFPINAFHLKNGVPKKPTFGVKLSTWRAGYSRTDRLGGMMSAMVGTMRQLHDYDFLLKNPDYNSLICHIEADNEFNWLDFNMPLNRQTELFNLGAERAFRFLEKFDWERYKRLRASGN